MEDWAEIRRLHRAEKMPIKAIARVMGCSKNTVSSALRASGPPVYRREAKGSLVDGVEPRIRELLQASARPPHTAASLWIVAGVDIKTVSTWFGHSAAKLTLDTYGHLMGTDADRAALDRVNRVLGSRTGPAEPEEQDEPGEGETENGS